MLFKKKNMHNKLNITLVESTLNTHTIVFFGGRGCTFAFQLC